MTRFVTFVVMDTEFRVEVPNAQSDQEAKAAALSRVAQSFHVRSVTTVKPQKRTTLWDTYKDGFRNFLSFTEQSTLDAERHLDAVLEEAFSTKRTEQ